MHRQTHPASGRVRAGLPASLPSGCLADAGVAGCYIMPPAAWQNILSQTRINVFVFATAAAEVRVAVADFVPAAAVVEVGRKLQLLQLELGCRLRLKLRLGL